MCYCLLLLQSVEEEQEGLLEREQQHSRKLDELQQQQQQQQPAVVTGTAAAPVPSAFAVPADMAPSVQQSAQQQQQQVLRAECAAVAAALSAAAGVPFPALPEPECMAASCYEEDIASAGCASGSDAADSSAEQQQRAPCMPFSLPEPASMVPSDAVESEVTIQDAQLKAYAWQVACVSICMAGRMREQPASSSPPVLTMFLPTVGSLYMPLMLCS
jgi:hypothetical protein